MRIRRSFLAVATLLLSSGPLAAGSALSTPTGDRSGEPASATAVTASDWPTYHRDKARTGYDPTATTASGVLRPAWSRGLDGAVYAEPLVVGAAVLVATENDSVYALGLDGSVRWRRHLGAPVPLSSLPCGNIDPLGITGTPVYDAASGSLFVVAELAAPTRHRLYALDPATGAVRWSRSADPTGMNVSYQQQRGALAIAGGKVWVTYGGLAGDCGNYSGWVVGSPTSGSGALVAYRTPSAREAGIWAPAGPSVDSTGRLYVAVGNGAATAAPYDDSDSVLQLSGTTVQSLFAPTDWARENALDLDLGSTGPALVSGGGGTWVLAAGKAGTVYLLNRADLGGIGGEAASYSGCTSFGGIAFRAGVAYLPCREGMMALAITSGPSLVARWHSTATGFGSVPVLGGGALWAVDNGVLLQLNPATGATVTSQAVGAAPHFATPTLHGNLVLVGTNAGVTAVRTS